MNMTEGKISKILFHYALPMILSLITQQLYNVADMIIVGRYLGVNELAAVGNAGTIVSILITLSGGLEMGSEVIFAKYNGAKRYQDIVSGAKSILVFGLIGGLCITVLGISLKTPILAWIKVPDELLANTGTFYNIYLIGLAGIFLYDISRAILVSLGSPKASMLLVILTSLLNVGLDLFFICVLKMGVGGAALATILAQFIGMIITLLLLRRKLRSFGMEFHTHGIQFTKIREILSISLPTIVQQGMLSVSSILLMSLVNPYGSEVISGYITVNKILLIGMLVAIGICQAFSVFTASNYGAGHIARIREAYRKCMIVTTGYLLLVIAANFLLPKQMIGAFLDTGKNPAAYRFAKEYLQYSSLTYLFYGWKVMNESLLRGFLKMKQYLYSNLSDLVFKVILSYAFVALFSTHGFWMGNMFGKVVSSGIATCIIIKMQLLSKSSFTN